MISGKQGSEPVFGTYRLNFTNISLIMHYAWTSKSAGNVHWDYRDKNVAQFSELISKRENRNSEHSFSTYLQSSLDIA